MADSSGNTTTNASAQPTLPQQPPLPLPQQPPLPLTPTTTTYTTTGEVIVQPPFAMEDGGLPDDPAAMAAGPAGIDPEAQPTRVSPRALRQAEGEKPPDSAGFETGAFESLESDFQEVRPHATPLADACCSPHSP